MHARSKMLGLIAIGPLLLAAAGCAGTAGASSEVARPTDGRVSSTGVTVTGLGRVTGRPDVLTANVGVAVTRDSVQAALDAADGASAAVLAALRDAGVAEDDIQTRELSVEPRYRHRNNAEPQVTGYQVSNIVEAKIRDLDRAGAVLSAAVEAGGDASRLHGVSFSLQDNQALLEAAREAAFADARAKAEQYAVLAGRQLGAVASISEVSAQPPTPMPFEAEAADVSAGALSIAPGQQQVDVRVTVVWDLG